MRINYNVSAMISNNALKNNDDALSQALERLSSGLKINHAKDNPAGLAMSRRMNAQIEGLSVANQNASDGVSIIETADGALSEVHEMLQRINELSVKAATGTISDNDRATIQDEVAALKAEITRISEDTQFNGQKLLNGEFDLKGYTTDENVKVMSYSDSVATDKYVIESLKVERDADGNLTAAEITFPATGNKFPADARVKEVKDNTVTIVGAEGFEVSLDVSAMSTDGDTAANLTLDLTGIGAMRLQVGSNEGQVLEIKIPAVSLTNMGIADIDVGTKEGAEDALSRMTDAISFVSSVRSRLGAYQNRLESNIGSLDITSENMTAAYSRIMDVDMAEEMTEYTKDQVLTQASTSMLAQANERPSQVLQLLQ